MLRMLLAAATAFALVTAAPALACPDCKNCEHHKVAAADKAEKKDAAGKVTCACAEAKDCKCGEKCDCPVCHPKKGEKKAEEAPKKS